MIAYNFPPHGGVGVQRSLKFVKYLPTFGWRPLVIAGDADAGAVQDESLLQQISPTAYIKRVPGFSMRRFVERTRNAGLKPLGVAANILSSVPDGEIFWSFKARNAVDELIRSERPHIIYTTSAPYSSHLLGLWIKRRYGLPWMADFRDPWSEHIFSTLQPPGYARVPSATQKLEDALAAAEGGFLPLHDKSSPEKVREIMGMSKKVFKQAVGSLYREKRIRIASDGIYLNP